MKELSNEYIVRRLAFRQTSFFTWITGWDLSLAGRLMLKDFSNIKGRLNGWTESSVEWYERASDFTGYYDRLVEKLLPFLGKESHCCEIACGTGVLARKIAPHVSSYTANDMDPEAVSFLRQKLSEPGMPEIEVIEGEWQEVLQGRKFDVLIASYYGVPEDLWPFLRSITSERFIAISPRSEKWKRSGHRSGVPEKDAARQPVKLETPDRMKEFYALHGIPFESLPLDFEFGQPFKDREEAERYVWHYYRLGGSEAEQFIDEKTCMKDGILYFPKLKQIEVISADLSGI